MTDLIDSLSIAECLDILKSAHPEQVHHQKEGEGDVIAVLIPLDCIRTKCRKIVENAPLFTRDKLNQPEAMYNLRTGHYVVRGLHSALVECEGNYYRSTMPYHSSFYSECIYLKDIEAVISLRHIRIEQIVIA